MSGYWCYACGEMHDSFWDCPSFAPESKDIVKRIAEGLIDGSEDEKSDTVSWADIA